MATVRFSEQLRENIIDNANRLYAERIEAAEANFNPEWGDQIYNLMFSTTKAKMLALPNGYLGTSRSISLYGFGDDTMGDISNVPVRLGLTTEMPFPGSMDAGLHGLSGDRHYGGHRLDGADPRWDTFKAEYLIFCKAKQKIVNERANFVAGVEKVLQAYTTLAPALKAWPALWDLLPQHTQERHKTIVERKKSELSTVDIDLSSMTAAVTAKKLRGE